MRSISFRVPQAKEQILLYKFLAQASLMVGSASPRAPNAAFHLEGNFLPEGNLGLWKEIWKEIAFGRKLGGNIVIRREMRRKSILSHNF